MPTIADFLASNASGKLQVPVPVWVRLHSNTTGTDYYSAALTDPLTGNWTATVPEDDYSQYYGVTQSVPGTPTLSDAHFRVAYTKNADATLNSLTITTGPLVLGADPGGGQLFRVGGTGHFSGLLTLDAGLKVTGYGVNPGGVFEAAIDLTPLGSGAGYIDRFFNLEFPNATGANSWNIYGSGGTVLASLKLGGAGVGGLLTVANGLTVSAGGAVLGTNAGSTASATLILNSATANQAYFYFLAAGAPIWQMGRNADNNDFFLYNQTSGYLPLNVAASTGLVSIGNGLVVNAGGLGVGLVTTSNQGANFSPSITATGGFATDLVLSPTLIAAANSDELRVIAVGAAAFNKGSSTGLSAYGIKVQGSAFTASGGGTIANAYGIHVSAPTIGTNNNYALYVDATGSTTSAPSIVSLGIFSFGQAGRVQFDYSNGLQVAHSNRLQIFSFWGTEIRGMTNTTSPSFVVGTTNDNSLTVYGPTSGTGLGLEVVSGGLKVTAGTTTLAGAVNLGANGAANVGGDVAISRNSSPTTGALFFGNTLSHSILWDGAQFIITETIAHTGQFKHSGTTFGLYGKTPVAQPAAPVTLADVIAIIRGCGLSA